MTQNEYIADLLMEAADALDDSVLTEGARQTYVKNLRNEYADRVRKGENANSQRMREIKDKLVRYEHGVTGTGNFVDTDGQHLNFRDKDPHFYQHDGKYLETNYRSKNSLNSVNNGLDNRNYDADEAKANFKNDFSGPKGSKLNRTINTKPKHGNPHEKRRHVTNECIADLLMEAADVLDEAAARNQRKSVRADSKIVEGKISAFLSGSLDKDEADKVYSKTKSEIDKLYKRVTEIPAETSGEKVWGYIRSYFTLKGFLRTLIINTAVTAVSSGIGTAIGIKGVENVVNSETIDDGLAAVKKTLGLSAAVGTGIGLVGTAGDIAAYRGIDSKVKGEKNNWNKAYALKSVKSLEKKLDKAYNKYYANKSQNECVADLLMEAAALLMEDDEY